MDGKQYMTAPRVHIIIVNWNGWTDTEECLDTFLGLEDSNFQVIISDNGSTDHSLERARNWAERHLWRFGVTSGSEETAWPENLTKDQSWSPTLVFLQNHANLGFTGANNTAMRLALSQDSDYFLLLNYDTLTTPEFLGTMLQTMDNDPGIGLLGCKILYADPAGQRRLIWSAGEKWITYGTVLADGINQTDGPRWTGLRDTIYVCGCALMIRKATARHIGLLDERFFFLAEDFEYGLRARRMGWKVKVNLDASIFHKVSRSTGTESPVPKYYHVRNLALARRLHFTSRENLWFSIMHPVHQIVLGGIRDILTGRGRRSAAAALGYWDFLTHRWGKCPYPAVNRPPRS